MEAVSRNAYIKQQQQQQQHELRLDRYKLYQERFEGGSGEAFWSSKPVKPTFSRESLLQARQESIRRGHVNKFQATSEAERRAAATAAAQWDEDGDARNPSWGSTSSVRRKKVEFPRQREGGSLVCWF